MEDIMFSLGGNDGISVPIVKAYSWKRLLKAEELLDSTRKYVIKWYWDRNNLENVLNGIDSLWETLQDTVAEEHLHDFLDQGHLSMSKDTLKAEYANHLEPFTDSLKHLTDFYIDVTADEESKQAYREYRKESRGRVVGLGFGITGGIKASVGAGLGNLASGMAHGAFNAIANGIGSIAKTVKLNAFYQNEETLSTLLDGWSRTFWRIYEGHLTLVNSILVEEGTSQIYSREKLVEYKKSAENRYQNIQKVKLSKEDHFEAIIECIHEFPFETQYWKEFFFFCIDLGTINISFYDNFWLFMEKIGEYDPDFNSEFAVELVEMFVNMFIETQKDSTAANEPILRFLKEKLEKDEKFEAVFDTVIEYKIKEKDASVEETLVLLGLIKALDYDLETYEHDDEFEKCYTDKLSRVTFDKINKNREKIIRNLQRGDVDSITKIIAEDGLINPEDALPCIFSIFKNNMNTIPITRSLLISFENLKTALKVNRDIDTYETFQALKDKIIEQEERVTFDKINKNREEIIRNLQGGDVDSIAKIITEDTSINPEDALSCIFSIFKNNMSTIPITRSLLISFENLKTALKVNRDIDTYETFQALKDKIIEQEERYRFLGEDDRLKRASKFKARRGFFRHILPASTIITIIFYGIIGFILAMIISLGYNVAPNEGIVALTSICILIGLIFPLILGLRARIKYAKEKKAWKECTNNGALDLKAVVKEYEKMLNDEIAAEK
jgi:nitrogenase subunit NifH